MDDPRALLRVLAYGDEQPWWRSPGLQVHPVKQAVGAAGHDAVVLPALTAMKLQDIEQLADIPRLAADAALLVLAPRLGVDDALSLVQMGAQDVLPVADTPTLARAVRLAVARKRLERTARIAYATDLATGLPHEAQLLEYLSHLIALRAREPAPLVLIVLRTEGLLRLAGPSGATGAQVLRRKLAVRLRAALRASDVVAALGSDMFGVLLGHIESAADGQTVLNKLQQTMRQPVQLGGSTHEVTVNAGMAQWPQQGSDAHELLRRAQAQAGSLVSLGEAVAQSPHGHGQLAERVAGLAANDEAAGA